MHMQFITEVNTIAVDNFSIGSSYNIRFTDDTLKTLTCIGKGTDFVMFQDRYPDLLFSLTMTTAASVASIDESSGGTTNYNDLSNKPQINSHTLFGNMSASDLGLVTPSDLSDYVTQDDLDDYVTDTDLTTALAGKQDVINDLTDIRSGAAAGATAVQPAALDDYATTAAVTTALAGKQDTLTTAQLSAVNSGVDSTKVDQIETNKNNILKVQTEADLNKSALLGTNIFDKSTFIYDAERSSTTGEVIPNSAKYGVSEIIPVRSGKTLYFSRNGTALAPTFIYTWQKDGTFIGRTSGAVTYSIPSNVGYISICIYYNDSRVNTYQVQYDKVTAYEEYARIYSNDIKQTADTFKLLASVNMFGSIAGIGDSYTAGLSANSGGTTQTMTEQSYIATMGKRSGVDWYNYGVSGATAKTYITNANGLPKVLAADAHDLYIVNIGQNDINVGSTVGTISDIHLADYTQNPDTYYGNMGSILSQLKAYAPNAKIILVKSWLNHNKSGTDISYQSLDSAIAEIAELYNIPCIAPFDDVFFNSTNYQNYRSLGHPTTMGYAMMGLAMERLLSKCIVANPSYFQFSTIG